MYIVHYIILQFYTVVSFVFRQLMRKTLPSIKIQYCIAYELILLFIYLSVHFFSSLLLDITHTRKFPNAQCILYINAFRIVFKAAAAWQVTNPHYFPRQLSTFVISKYHNLAAEIFPVKNRRLVL